MADANLQNLLRQDWQAVQKYVDSHIAGDLVYIVVYDRAAQPAAWNTLASGRTASSFPPAFSATP